MSQYGVCTWIFGGEPLSQTAARLKRSATTAWSSWAT